MPGHRAPLDGTVPYREQDRGCTVQRGIDWREYAVVHLQLDLGGRLSCSAIHDQKGYAKDHDGKRHQNNERGREGELIHRCGCREERGAQDIESVREWIQSHYPPNPS